MRRTGRRARRRSSVVRLLAARSLTVLARCYPWPVEPSDDLRRALGFIDAPIDAETVVRGGFGAASVAAVVCLALGWVLLGAILDPAATPVTAVASALASAVAVAHAVHRAPLLYARIRRTRALGSTTGLVGRAVLRMRIEPAAERAARFAARTGTGPLAASLDEHVRRASGTPTTGFRGFAAEWSDWFPALDRSIGLLTASASAPTAERERVLDRSIRAALDGTHDRMAAFAVAVRGPATAVYAFGVLLPLALVGTLPAARTAGMDVSVATFVACYDVVLPLALVAAVGWLLVRRPVAFPPTTVSADHPDVPNRPWLPPLVGVTTGGLGWIVASEVVDWAGPIGGVGFGVGAALFVHYRPIEAVRDDVRAVESGLPDALSLVGRRIAEGQAVEVALARVSENLTGATGEALADAVRVQRALRIDVGAALLGEYGALASVPSPRARGAARLLALAATEGRPAGSVVVSMADQLDELRRVEREARRELASVTETLANTATVFAPLVGGATVALSGRVASAVGSGSSSVGGGTASATTTATATATASSVSVAGVSSFGSMGGGSATALPTSAIGVAVGVYVLLLATILTTLAAGLDRGLDRALVGYRIGLALPTATAAYLAAVVGAGLLV